MRLFAAISALIFSSCAGYHLGGTKPAKLANIHCIAVPMFKNDTQQPRAEALATSAVTSALIQDGTYRLTSRDKADAVLEATLHKIEYVQIRATRLDTMRPQELQNVVTINWFLRDAHNHSHILSSGSTTGQSRFFVDSDLQISRNNALPDAMERASQSLVSRIANGF